MFLTLMPRKLIWVCGLAVSLSGVGETSTVVPASAALRSSDCERQAGEGPLGGIVELALEEPPPVPSLTATAIHATSATSRTMYPYLLIVRAPARRCPLQGGV